MQFPRQVFIGSDHYQSKQVRNGVLFTREHIERPYVFIPGAQLNDASSFFNNGVYRARISMSHRPAEFQRGAPAPYVTGDEMVRGGTVDPETREFARAFWVAITTSPH